MAGGWRGYFRGFLGTLSSISTSVCSHDARNWVGLPTYPCHAASRSCHASVTLWYAHVTQSPSVALRPRGVLLVLFKCMNYACVKWFFNQKINVWFVYVNSIYFSKSQISLFFHNHISKRSGVDSTPRAPHILQKQINIFFILKGKNRKYFSVKKSVFFMYEFIHVNFQRATLKIMTSITQFQKYSDRKIGTLPNP